MSSLHLLVAVVAGLLTATSNAVAVTTQHVASQREKGSHHGWERISFVLRQPLWWVGGLGLTGSLVFQAIALHFGPLSLVQPLLVSEVVLTLVLRRWWLGQSLSPRAWRTSVVTVVTLSLFLLVTSPGTGLVTASPTAWRLVGLGSLVGAGALAMAGTWGSPARRAACWGTVTAVAWAFEAVLIRALSDTIAASGWLTLWRHWPLYGFVVVGVAGLAAEQIALHVGPLRVTQPCIVVLDPLASLLYGVTLFHERWASGPLRLASGLLLLGGLTWSTIHLLAVVPDITERDT